MAIVFVLAVATVGVFTFQLSQQLETLTHKVDSLAGEISGIQETITADTTPELINDLDRLASSIENLRGGIDALRTEVQAVADTDSRLVANQVYNEVRESVVLIAVSTRGGFGSGSGFVYDEMGHILTNNHVIQGAIEIDVLFEDGIVVSASVVGTDPFSDLAVLQLESLPRDLKPVTLGDSSALKVGEQVIAIGSPFGLSGTVTVGVVSQTSRLLPGQTGYPIPNVVQIDAAVNPGNSGGPLLNAKGEVVGITTAGVGINLNFAIPSNTVKREVPLLIAEGTYAHPWVGVATTGITPEIASTMNLNSTKGLLVVDVAPGGPAELAGLRGGTATLIIGGVEVPIGGDVIIGADEISVTKF
ncbi:MAG: S1C family serine protease, partial [Candidatus Bathyarchaeia archaeon]